MIHQIPEETYINTNEDQSETNGTPEDEASKIVQPSVTKSPPQVSSEVPRYVPPHRYAHFPSRLVKKEDHNKKHFGKFLDVLKQLHVNLPLTEVITQMPLYAKFFKEILSSRRKLEEVQRIELTSNGSALVKNKLPKKLDDPGKFIA